MVAIDNNVLTTMSNVHLRDYSVGAFAHHSANVTGLGALAQDDSNDAVLSDSSAIVTSHILASRHSRGVVIEAVPCLHIDPLRIDDHSIGTYGFSRARTSRTPPGDNPFPMSGRVPLTRHDRRDP